MNTSNNSIAELAYRLWQARGCPHDGSSEQDWIEAERMAAGAAQQNLSGAKNGDETSIESFPAVDPAAGHTPAAPPSNSPQKWSGRPSEKPRRDRK